MNSIITANTLVGMGDARYADYLCHAYCSKGTCTFSRGDEKFQLCAGDCLIVPRRADMYQQIEESADFEVDVIYITQAFIETATPPSNYGMRGHLWLFANPVMHLTPPMQQRCARNFKDIRERLEQEAHHFQRDVLVCAVQTMILDFFDFHATLYGFDRITVGQHYVMEQFLALLERGDYRRNRDVGYYAAQLCITPKHLSEVCKKASGLPAAYWITRYTALDISRQLRDRRLSLADIADSFCFSSPAHFSRYVQNNLGAKPSDFRE
ncbi:MAG: AraC family transcriptional regulator [Alloprevotella sp.]|nr:AraC family transcriptional regulator [Alloprevotella sp.]